jgi:hypothetical protein
LPTANGCGPGASSASRVVTRSGQCAGSKGPQRSTGSRQTTGADVPHLL